MSRSVFENRIASQEKKTAGNPEAVNSNEGAGIHSSRGEKPAHGQRSASGRLHTCEGERQGVEKVSRSNNSKKFNWRV